MFPGKGDRFQGSFPLGYSKAPLLPPHVSAIKLLGWMFNTQFSFGEIDVQYIPSVSKWHVVLQELCFIYKLFRLSSIILQDNVKISTQNADKTMIHRWDDQWLM